MERTFAWLLFNRRLVVDYERKVQTSETLIEVAMIHLLVARLRSWTYQSSSLLEERRALIEADGSSSHVAQ